MIRVVAFQLGALPKARVGSWIAMHAYYRALVDAGHKVSVLIPQRGRSYELDGVQYTEVRGNLWPKLSRSQVAISLHGDDAALHRSALAERKPSIRFVHGTHDMLFHKLLKYGQPTLTVFNSHSLAAHCGYGGPQMVCHPYIDPAQFDTTPGEHVTLVNLIDSKGYQTFDALARYLPDRKFLGVAGGYGRQVNEGRRNVTFALPTRNVRDDILAKTRILLMPSEHETWGMIGVEAMCAGIPVIAHPTPGLCESLGDAGFFADRVAVDEWLDIIEALDNEVAYRIASDRAKARSLQLAADDSRTRFVTALEGLV
jgi:glycosyltransferase involved in cell wall biosynthesis